MKDGLSIENSAKKMTKDNNDGNSRCSIINIGTSPTLPIDTQNNIAGTNDSVILVRK